MTTVAFPTISKSTRLPNGTTYSYVNISPKDDKPCILFLHGFPSSSYDWRHQIHFFSRLGYGILAPDLLGYGGTDKPSDPAAYRLKKMSEEIVAILDAEGLDTVIGVAHDWGCALLSRLANYFPERLVKLSFMNVGYMPPQGRFDIDAVNASLESRLGYPAYAYWDFFLDSRAAELLHDDVERTLSTFYWGNESKAKEIFCVKGATLAWFANKGSPSPTSSLLPKDEFATRLKIFDPKNGGYEPPLNWYRAYQADVNFSDEANIPSERVHVQQRTLAILGNGDFICVPAVQEATMRPFVPNLKIVRVEGSHWAHLAKPDEFNEALKEFFEEADEKSNL